MSIILFLDFAGVFVFAATGALAASRRQLDIIGFIFLANITGFGGGTVRDIILGDTPVIWVKDPTYLLIGTSAALIVYVLAHKVESRYRALLWLDAIGMAMFATMGAAKGLSLGFGASIAIVMGIFTATLGGIMRDIVAGEPSVLMRREIYISAALIGAAAYVILWHLTHDPLYSAIPATLIAFMVRGGALLFGWKLPNYHAKRGRTPEELERDGIVPHDD